MKTRTAFIAITATAAVSGLVGIGAGGSTAVEPEVVTETVTKTVEVEVPSEPEVITEIETVTETVEVEVTPSACLEALALADEGFGYAADGMGAAGDGFGAVARSDVAGLEEATTRMIESGNNINAIVTTYQVAKAECQASQ